MDTRKHVIVAAWAEHAKGPGWQNEPIWYLTREVDTGKYQIECLQPGEHTAEMHILYEISATVHHTMTSAVRRALYDRGVKVVLPQTEKGVLGT